MHMQGNWEVIEDGKWSHGAFYLFNREMKGDSHL